MDDGAQFLGGAGLVGLAAPVASRVAVQVLDCLEPAIAAVRRAGPRRSPPRRTPGSPGSFTGIGAALAGLLSADIVKGT